MKFCSICFVFDYKRVPIRQQFFPLSPLLLLSDPGSGILRSESGTVDPESGIGDPGSGIRDPGSEILDPGSEIRDPGSEIRDLGSEIWDPRPGIRDG
jgi:hypothetical protein